jgi:hypothetical protein
VKKGQVWPPQEPDNNKGRMKMQTDDNRQGMYEGVIACYLDERIDSVEFWEVIDNRIYAEHETVLDFIKLVTVDSGYIYAWLESEQANDLISACPTVEANAIINSEHDREMLEEEFLQRSGNIY